MAASAAARIITKIAAICPSIFIPPYFAKAMKLIFAAFRTNSNPIRTIIACLRVIIPYKPSENNIALINK